MCLMRGGPFVYQMVAAAFGDAKSLVNFPHEKEPRRTGAFSGILNFRSIRVKYMGGFLDMSN